MTLLLLLIYMLKFNMEKKIRIKNKLNKVRLNIYHRLHSPHMDMSQHWQAPLSTHGYVLTLTIRVVWEIIFLIGKENIGKDTNFNLILNICQQSLLQCYNFDEILIWGTNRSCPWRIPAYQCRVLSLGRFVCDCLSMVIF